MAMESTAELRNLLAAVFGESEDEEDELLEPQEWERIADIDGLWICRNFLSLQEQQDLVKDIESESWFVEPEDNQAMRFGGLPSWALNLSASIRSSLRANKQCSTSKQHPLPVEILSREPLFDQMIVNSYQPLEGINAHVDLLRFEDGIAILSLISSRVMTFKHKADEVPVLLFPGDLVLMSGVARYKWTHEINAEKQLWNGEPVLLDRRISVTLRRLCKEQSHTIT